MGGVLDPAFTFSQPSSNDVDDGSLRVAWPSLRPPDSPDSALLANSSSLRCWVRLRTEAPIERPRRRKKTCDELVTAIPARRSSTKVRIKAMVSADGVGWREKKSESSCQLPGGGGSLMAEHVCSFDFLKLQPAHSLSCGSSGVAAAGGYSRALANLISHVKSTRFETLDHPISVPAHHLSTSPQWHPLPPRGGSTPPSSDVPHPSAPPSSNLGPSPVPALESCPSPTLQLLDRTRFWTAYTR